MYSLDINLLRERAEYQTGQQSDLRSGMPTASRPKYGKIPLFAGLGVAALALMATGGSWLYLGQQTTQLEAKQKDLDRKLGNLKDQDAQIAKLNGQVAQITGETESLASVFNQVQPWSAVLQDLRESIPQGVQIATVAQSEVKPTAPAAAAPVAAAPSGGLINKISTPPNPEAKPTASPSPAATTAATPAAVTPAPEATPTVTALLPADVPITKINITGLAKSYEQVNNFSLTLKHSAFFEPDDTQVVRAALMSKSVELPAPPSLGSSGQIGQSSPTAGSDRVKPPTKVAKYEVVAYEMQTSLKRVPATDLLRELERKGAVGLVTRLKSLQQQQTAKP
jgi:type IV pilus assembly protein PilN